MSKKIRIPTLKKDETNRRAEVHLPLKVRDGKALQVPKHNIKEFSYPFSLTFGGEIQPGKIVGSAFTLHEYGYAGVFKPSVYEVICQIPKDLVDTPTWFIICGPQTAADFYRSMESEDEARVREIMEAPDDDSVRKAFDAGFHTARTIFYERAV